MAEIRVEEKRRGLGLLWAVGEPRLASWQTVRWTLGALTIEPRSHRVARAGEPDPVSGARE